MCLLPSTAGRGLEGALAEAGREDGAGFGRAWSGQERSNDNDNEMSYLLTTYCVLGAKILRAGIPSTKPRACLHTPSYGELMTSRGLFLYFGMLQFPSKLLILAQRPTRSACWPFLCSAGSPLAWPCLCPVSSASPTRMAIVGLVMVPTLFSTPHMC